MGILAIELPVFNICQTSRITDSIHYPNGRYQVIRRFLPLFVGLTGLLALVVGSAPTAEGLTASPLEELVATPGLESLQRG